jgi:hypothetical protein
MALMDRVIGRVPNKPPLSPHDLLAMIHELSLSGGVTKANFVSFYEFDAGEESDLDWLITKYTASTDKIRWGLLLWSVLCIGQESTQSTYYKNQADIVARINQFP